MFHQIVVPLDGSHLAECALLHAVAMARTYDAEVTLLHVLDRGSEPHRAPIDPLTWRIRRAEVDAYLELWQDRLAALGIPTQRQVRQGRAAGAILEAAADLESDLIVLGSHGRGGLSPWTISSVVQKIVWRAQCSVLIARSYHATDPLSQQDLYRYKYRRLLVPLDGSRRAEYVLPAVRALARHQPLYTQAPVRVSPLEQPLAPLDCVKVVLAHIVQPPDLPRQTPPTHEEVEMVQRLVECNQRQAQAYLERIAAQFEAPVEQHLLVEKSAASALQHLATVDGTADLVVLCAHGYSGDRSVRYGSVATSFIVHSDVPLLIVQDLPRRTETDSAAAIAAAQVKGH